MGILPWALTSSTTGQGVFTITSLGLERRPVLSTPHRVNLAGRGGCSYQRMARLCLDEGEGFAPQLLCDSTMHLLPPLRSQGVWSQASHCFLVGLRLGFLVLGILSDGKHHSIEHWFSKWGPQTCSSRVMPHPNLLDGDSRDGAQAILMPVTF